jgi:hypothetical protein
MEFADPPEARHRADREYWAGVAKQLKEQPGEWGKTGPYSVGVANHIRNGRYVAFLAPLVKDRKDYVSRHWEVTTTSAEEGRNYVYIRWIGNGCACPDCP